MKSTLRHFVRLILGSALLPLLGANEPAAAPAPEYVACKIHQLAVAKYPARLFHNGVLRGDAQVVLEVDAKGHLTDSLVMAYTHKEFADEVMRVVKQWQFEPGLLRNEPVITVLTVDFKFEITGVAIITKNMNLLIQEAMENESLAYRPRGMKNLDQIPVPISVTGPIYPKEWIDQGRSGKVTVQFFIDEQGRTRMPTLVGTADNLLAGSAIDAVMQWHFEPPKYHGEPVLVHAEQEFVFRSPTPTPHALSSVKP